MKKLYKKKSQKAENAADPTDVNEAVSQGNIALFNTCVELFSDCGHLLR